MSKGPSGSQVNQAKQEKITVFGHMFLPEARTMCNVLDISGIKYVSDTTTDIFTKSGFEDYKSINPARQMVTVQVGSTSLVSDPANLLRYICKSQDRTYKLYPENKRKSIDIYLDFIYVMLKRVCNRLTKLRIQREIPNKPGQKIDAKKEKEDFDGELAIINETFIVQLEETLEQTKSYLTGNDMTIADLAYYNELKNVYDLLETSFDQNKFPRTSNWYRNMDDNTHIQTSNKLFIGKLEEVKQKFN